MAEHERERETVVVTDTGERRGGGGLAAILLVIVLAVILFLVFGRGLLSGGGTETIKADVDIEAPTK